MLKNFLAAFSIASLTAIAPSYSEEVKTKGVYFVGSVGMGQMADIDIHSSDGGGKMKFDSGFAGDLGIGYDFGPFRTQFIYNSTNTDLTSIQGTAVDIGVDSSSYLFEGAIDFRDGKDWQPYVGLGVGTSKINVTLAQTVGSVALTVETIPSHLLLED